MATQGHGGSAVYFTESEPVGVEFHQAEQSEVGFGTPCLVLSVSLSGNAMCLPQFSRGFVLVQTCAHTHTLIPHSFQGHIILRDS